MFQLSPRNFRNSNNNTPVSNTRSSLLRKKSVFESIEADKIGEGKYFTKGSYGNRKNLGLKGQISKLKRAGKNLVTKNLSRKNLDDIYDIISTRLKGHNVGYGVHINRNDKIAMMQKAERLVRTQGSKFSREDKADLERVIDVLKQQGKEAILKKRYNNPQSPKSDTLLKNKDKKIVNKNLESEQSYLSNFIKPLVNNFKNNQRLNDKKDELDYKMGNLGDVNISEPLKIDEEIENLRNQAKDLAI